MSLSRRQILQAGLAAPLLIELPLTARAQSLDLARILIGFPAGGTMTPSAATSPKNYSPNMRAA